MDKRLTTIAIGLALASPYTTASAQTSNGGLPANDNGISIPIKGKWKAARIVKMHKD